MEPRFVLLQGARLAYRLAGQGPLLLLVHGMAGSSETWKHVMPNLAGRFTVLAPDLLGQGLSDQPSVEYSLDTHADSLRDLMDALGFESATLVGQSLGGGVAMQLASRFPSLGERLVLVDSGGLGREVTFYLRLLSAPGFESIFPLFCGTSLRDAGDRLAAWLAGAGMNSKPAAQEVWRSYSSLAEAGKRRAFFRSLRSVIDFGGQSVSALERLASIAHLPTLIVWGAKDPFIPVSHAHAAHAAIAGSRLEIFDEVGHYPHCEAPERFVNLLEEFIDSTEPARPGPPAEGAASSPASG